MKKFTLAIEETVVGKFNVVAKSAEDAMKIACEKYKNGEFVLEPGEVQNKQMAIISPDKECTEWVEF